MTDNLIDFLTGTFIGLLAWFFGGLDGFLMVLVTLTIIDYISGIGAAVVQKVKLSSSVGFNGLARKMAIFSFVGMAHIIDKYLLGGTETLRTAVCLFYIGNEGISIFENADKMRIPIPAILREKFLHFTNNHDNDNTKQKS